MEADAGYFGFIDAAMVREAFARPVIQELMLALPAALRRPDAPTRVPEPIASATERTDGVAASPAA